MIESIVKKIMITGINKYAKAYGLTSDRVQIKVTNDPSGTVLYTVCNNFKAVENVRFLDIMDKKFDIFQYETLANPFLKKSLSLYADETNDNIENVCSFIMEVNNNVGLAFYNGYKNGKNISLGKHLSELGL